MLEDKIRVVHCTVAGGCTSQYARQCGGSSLANFENSPRNRQSANSRPRQRSCQNERDGLWPDVHLRLKLGSA